MRCNTVLDFLLETTGEDLPQPVRDHLAGCRECQAAAREWRLLRQGMAGLAQKQPPEPSLGFSTRVMRRIEEAARRRDASEVGVERAGRRFVYAALMAVLILVLCLVVPSSGPVRTPGSPEVYPLLQEAVSAQNYPVFPGQPLDGRYEFSLVSDHVGGAGSR